MKLLKTLNNALGDNALQDAHIDEAFDVWWPKLESQLKMLPPEETKAKTHRPDRELLEEILALVRNQNRAANDPDDSEMSKAMWTAFRAADPSIHGMTYRKHQGTITGETTGERKFKFAFPTDATSDEIVEIVTTQIRSQLLKESKGATASKILDSTEPV